MVKTYNPIISQKLNINKLKKKQLTKKISDKKSEKMSQTNEHNSNHVDKAHLKKQSTKKMSQLNEHKTNTHDKEHLNKSKLTNEILKLVNKKYIFTEKCPHSITYDLLSEIIPSYYNKSEFDKDSLWVSYYTTMNLQSYNHKPKHISFDELK
jgi:hypothetical protein